MGQSLSKIYVHLIFSTKHRQPLIVDNIEGKLHAYLGGICRGLECPPIKVGGWLDHVHILCMLLKKISLIKLLEDVKSGSSKWVKTNGRMFGQFYWQDGYGAFSVSPANVDAVVEYIANQKDHHSKVSFQDEYRAFLKEYAIEYNERFVWD